MAKSIILDLNQLSAPLPALTKSRGESMAEAASVVLYEKGHRTGTKLKVKGHFKRGFLLNCVQVDKRLQNSYYDLQEAVEQGAYGVAILLIITLTEYTLIRRSRKGTGFDYWLGKKEDPLFQDAARLEVSGILQENKKNTTQRRIKEKKKQTEVSDEMKLPAWIVVVEFGTPKAHIELR